MHPTLTADLEEWIKWRLTFAGGKAFINRYLKKYSRREDEQDFQTRKELTYVPAFAKSAINEIKNSIFQRLVDIARVDGPDSYQAAVAGQSGGVDGTGTDMNTFVGESIILDLLVMKKIGVYIDMDSEVPELYNPNTVKHPYIYTYCAEDITNWVETRNGNNVEFQKLELTDYDYTFDEFGMPNGNGVSTRKIWIGQDGYVNVQIGDGEITVLKLKKIPFVCFEISDSLLKDVANYQIALMNLASSDLMYSLQSNFPFYTEQTSKFASTHLNTSGDGTQTGAETAKDPNQIKVGTTQGRSYAAGTERPAFINPSSEPLEISMKKQEQLKEEIRQLINLALSNIRPKMASAESKDLDTRGMEAGLSYIAMELQRGERQIAEFWATYEGKDSATVNYPQLYMLKTDEDRWNEAEKLALRIKDTPSITYKKEICKKIARIMLGGKVTEDKIRTIEAEIDEAPTIINDPQMLLTNLQNGVLDNVTAALAQGIPEDSPKKAEKEHAARLARISASQSPDGNGVGSAARGVPDGDPNPGSGSQEKAAAADQTMKGSPANAGRGAGRA